MKLILLVAFLSFQLLLTSAATIEGICVLNGTLFAPEAKGVVIFKTMRDGYVDINGNFSGFSDISRTGSNIFMIHQYGFVGTEDGEGTGPIFMGREGLIKNLTFDEKGTSTFRTRKRLNLRGPRSIIGRSCVVHQLVRENRTHRILSQGVIGVRNTLPKKNLATPPNATWATCEVMGVYNASVYGRITFQQIDVSTISKAYVQDRVRVKAKVCGINGTRGFHVHEFGDISGNPLNEKIGDHFNPTDAPHALPNGKHRHVGDMGNIVSEDSVAYFDKTFDIMTLSGNNSIVGRTTAIHEKHDTGRGKTGEAGDKIAICVIGIAKGDTNSTAIECKTRK